MPNSLTQLTRFSRSIVRIKFPPLRKFEERIARFPIEPNQALLDGGHAQDWAQWELKNALRKSAKPSLLKAFGEVSKGKFLLFENFPIGNHVSSEHQEKVTGSAILGALKLAGYDIAHEPYENPFKAINRVEAKKGNDKREVGTSPNRILPHADHVYAKKPPHVQILVGIRGDENVVTPYWDILDITSRMPMDAVQALYTEPFKIRQDPLKRHDDPEQMGGSYPIFDKDSEGFVTSRIYLDPSKITPCTPKGRDALNCLRNVLENMKPTVEVMFKPGTAAIWPNAVSANEAGGYLHARSFINEDQPMRHDRLLNRAYGNPQRSNIFAQSSSPSPHATVHEEARDQDAFFKPVVAQGNRPIESKSR